MRRILAMAFAAALALLALQAPATAKGPDSATITGPGIGTKELTWRGHGQSLEALLQISRFWDGPDLAAWGVEPPAGDLGPRFELTYHVSGPEGSPIRQDLYPFATGGPVIHMAEGQAMYGMGMPYGWLATDDRLTRIVERLGGTDRTAEPRISPAAHEASTSGGGPSGGTLALGAAGAVLLAAATAALLRGRVRRRA